MTYTKMRENPDRTTEAVSFGVEDDRGRVVGAIITRSTVVFEALPEDARGGWATPPGFYYRAMCRATRDGIPYGRLQSGTYHATEAEREERIRSYLKNATARAVRKWGG